MMHDGVTAQQTFRQTIMLDMTLKPNINVNSFLVSTEHKIFLIFQRLAFSFF